MCAGGNKKKQGKKGGKVKESCKYIASFTIFMIEYLSSIERCSPP